MNQKLAGIIGLGLIGGSIARALKSRLDMNIIGIVISFNSLESLNNAEIILNSKGYITGK